jgi:hypothetical protein
VALTSSTSGARATPPSLLPLLAIVLQHIASVALWLLLPMQLALLLALPPSSPPPSLPRPRHLQAMSLDPPVSDERSSSLLTTLLTFTNSQTSPFPGGEGYCYRRLCSYEHSCLSVPRVPNRPTNCLTIDH